MGTIANLFDTAFRFWNVDGVPASGAHKPDKAEIQAIGDAIDSALATQGLGSVGVTKDTAANLAADLAHDDGTTALVYADPDASNNDIWVKTGASGSGSWSNTNIIHSAIESVSGPQVELARAWATSPDEPDPDNAPGEQSAKTYALLAFTAPLKPTMTGLRQAVDYGQTELPDALDFIDSSMVLDPAGPAFRSQENYAQTLAGLSIASCSRASSGWAKNADGSLTKFAADTVRVTDAGITIEPSPATNLVTSPDDLTAWTASNCAVATGQLAPDGTNTAHRLTDSSTTAIGSVSSATTAAIAVAPYTASVYIKKEAGGAAICTIRWQFTGGTTQDVFVYLAPDTGVATSTGSIAVKVEPAKDSAGNDWWRVSRVSTPTATHTGVNLLLYPAGRLNGGTSDDATATGAITVWMPQIESGSTASTPRIGTPDAERVTIDLFAGSDGDVVDVSVDGVPQSLARSSLASSDALVIGADGDITTNGVYSYINLIPPGAILGKTVVALRSSALSGGQPSTLATDDSPTITYGARGGASTLTGSLVPWNAPGKYNYISAAWQQAGASYPDTLAGRPNNTTYLTDGSSFTAVCGAIEFDHAGDAFEVYQKGFTGSTFRLYVDGQISGNAYPPVPSGADAAGGLHYTLVSFGSSATRRIRIEVVAGVFELLGIQIKTGQSITASPAYPLRCVVAGDSFTEGSGADSSVTGFAPMLAQELGIGDFRISGSGGTGWMQTSLVGAVLRCNLEDRWDTDVTGASPHVAVIAMGYNDLGDGNDAEIGTIAATKIAALRVARPGCLIHVIGPWDSNAYTGTDGSGGEHTASDPTADCVSMTAALEAACEGISGVWFHSMIGIGFQPSGGALTIHPTQAGHETLFRYIYGEMAAIHGLRALS